MAYDHLLVFWKAMRLAGTISQWIMRIVEQQVSAENFLELIPKRITASLWQM